MVGALNNIFTTGQHKRRHRRQWSDCASNYRPRITSPLYEIILSLDARPLFLPYALEESGRSLSGRNNSDWLIVKDTPLCVCVCVCVWGGGVDVVTSVCMRVYLLSFRLLAERLTTRPSLAVLKVL